MSLKTADFPSVIRAKEIAHTQMRYYMEMMPDPNVQAELQSMLRKNDDYMFFQVAYQWRYGKQVEVHGDVVAWRVQQVIPAYVASFVQHVRSAAPMSEEKTVVLASDYWKQQRGNADDDAFGF